VQCEPRQLEALCGCRSGGGGTTPALALLLALAWRARKKRRAPAGERS
jgi:MYXO-CTERM domain-containing protein